MKRHHIVSMFSFISGGLFAYIQFRHGDTEDAIQTGIICTLVAVAALLYQKLRSWLRPVGITVPLIILGFWTADAAFRGDMTLAILLCIGVIGIAILHFFEDTSFVKEKMEPHIGLIALLLVTRFILFSR